MDSDSDSLDANDYEEALEIANQWCYQWYSEHLQAARGDYYVIIFRNGLPYGCYTGYLSFDLAEIPIPSIKD